MTCVSEVSAIPRSAGVFNWTSLSHRLEIWWQTRAALKTERDVALLNDRELRDLGIEQGWVMPPRRSELDMLWPPRGTA